MILLGHMWNQMIKDSAEIETAELRRISACHDDCRMKDTRVHGEGDIVMAAGGLP